MDNDITKQDTQAPSDLALNNNETDSLFGESSIVAEKLSFPKIVIMREVPQFDLGSGDLTPTLVGHVLFTHPSNTWWEVDFTDRDASERGAPDCASSMGHKPDSGENIQTELMPVPQQDGSTIMQRKPCSTCPKAVWGSGKGENGTACRMGAMMLFLREGSVLPGVISLNPASCHGKDTSYGPWLSKAINSVFSTLTAQGIKMDPTKQHCWPALAELTLATKDFTTGNSASVLHIKTLSVLSCDTPENKEKLKKLGNQKNWARQIYMNEMQSYIDGVTEQKEPEVKVDREAAIDAEATEDSIPL